MLKRALLNIPCGKCFLVFLAILFLGGLLFAWSGLYSVAASKGHWWGVELLLKFGMRSSVRTHSIGIEIPDLSNPNSIQKGAAHFEIGCASCHGSPASIASPVARAMLPEPPHLEASVPTWKPNELFWIVKNGLKYTGMPAWPAKERDDEVWAIVAFLLQLPGMNAAKYAELSHSRPTMQIIPSREALQHEPIVNIISTCARCHQPTSEGNLQGAVPHLDIQTREYLGQQLSAYASGLRFSGIMQTAVAGINEDTMAELAVYFAEKKPDQRPVPFPDSTASAELGWKLANTGLSEEGLPACYSCHSLDSTKRDPLYPAIASQTATFTSEQLVLFKHGKRGTTPETEIMNVIAQRMTAEQIAAVSNYLEQAGPTQVPP